MMPRFGGKQDLKKSQLRDRRCRRRGAGRGESAPIGSKPREHKVEEPWLVPTAQPIADPVAFLARLRKRFNWR